MIFLPHKRKAFQSSGYDGSANLVLRWRMEELSGNFANSPTATLGTPDASVVGVIQGSAVRGAVGKYGYGLSCPTGSDFVRSVWGGGFTNYLQGIFGANDFSTSVWVKLTSRPVAGKWFVVSFIGRQDPVSYGTIMEVLVHASGNLYLHNFGETLDFGVTMPLGVWTHIAVTREVSARKYRLYLNGVEYTVTAATAPALDGYVVASAGGSKVAMTYSYNSNPGGAWVDDFRGYNVRLTPTQVASIYAGTDLQTP